MQLCSRCNAAIDPGRTHCPVCDLPVAGISHDPTRIQGGPPTPAAGTLPVPAHPPVPAPGHGYAAPPGYGPPPGYGAPPGYGPMPGYGAPGYGVAPPPAPRSKVAAALLCFFLGGLGIHRFYTGQVGLGLGLLLTSVILGPLTCGIWYVVTLVWVIVDFVLILSGGVSDQWGRPLV